MKWVTFLFGISEQMEVVGFAIMALVLLGGLAWLCFALLAKSDREEANREAGRLAEANREAGRLAASRRALIEAERAYESALMALEADNSTEHKKRALESGRKYAALSREAHEGDKSVTLFDEVALTNDINARIK